MRTWDRENAGRFGRALRVLAALVLFALPTTSAAQVVTFTSATASWRNPQDNMPGVQTGDPAITNGVPTSSISWGGASPQSGYDVTITIPDPNAFPVADFSHRNFTVPDPSLTSVELDFVLDFAIDGTPTGPLTFTFTFNHEETQNNLDPCPYPTPPGEGCTDRVIFFEAPDPTTFTIDGKTYTLGLSFLNPSGDPIGEFITREGGVVNTADLDTDFALVPPVLEVTKTGPATLTLAQPGEFVLDVRNTGPNDAWNATVLDRLPDGATGGLCDVPPEVTGAQVFAADGLTPVPGKGPLVEGVDFTATFAGAPTCELSLTMVSAAAVVSENERLILTYRAQLDGDTQGGVALTNVAGATEWFDDPPSNPLRGTYVRTLTDGTVGTTDHEDAHTVATDPLDYLFEKTVVDPVSGDPVTAAMPGDSLRYRLRFENRSPNALGGFDVRDEIDRLNGAPLFEAGSLVLVTVPAGADTSGFDVNGGGAGTGLVEVRDLTLAPTSSLLIEYDVTLATPIADGTVATNQAEVLIADVAFGLSDDPGIGGAADPFVAGDEDPTIVAIASAPVFRVEKVSQDLDGDPAVLLAGERLRYTITVKNVGSENATDTILRDAIPVNTTYVAGSTTLNGLAVADAPGDASPLSAGLLLSAPEDPTPGAMRADAAPAADNVATLVFDVRVDDGVIDGTVIANQAFVSAPGGGVIDQPSDDPGTDVPDDPTRDVVGGAPLLFAPKSVVLLVDGGVIGQVDPGDRLRYTITVYNDGSVPATNAVLSDAVPTYTDYVPGSTLLNGDAVPDPPGADGPLAAIGGLPISSSDATPPLPAPGAGILNPGENAVVQFDLDVEATAPAGGIISNQAVVSTDELLDTLTDGDGNPATGPEPTVVVVGGAEQVSITKQVAVVGGGPALTGGTLEYTVTVRNIGSVPTTNVVVTDPIPAGTTYVPGSAVLDGATAGVNDGGGALITADYGATYGDLPVGAALTLRFQVTVVAAMGTPITNTATVTWSAASMADATATITVGGTPGVGTLAGSVWHDQDFDDLPGGTTDLAQAGWAVELLRNGAALQTATTDASGAYVFRGIPPNDVSGDAYAVRFRAPGAGPATASMGATVSPYTDGQQLVSAIVLASGGIATDLNLPVTPNGLVYDAIARTPVAGATLRMRAVGSGALLPTSCFADPNQQNQVTPPSGWYKFDLVFGPSCPDGGGYLIESQVPTGGSFTDAVSALIPPQSDATTLPFSVPTCPGTVGVDAIPATNAHCEVRDDANVPTEASGAAGTNYQLHLTLSSAAAGTNQIFNNAIPIDPVLGGAVAIRKTTPKIDVVRGELVPYEIVVDNTLGVALGDLQIIDRFPAGFRYVEGSARLDGVPTEPTRLGNELTWTGLSLAPGTPRTIVLLLAVGAGVTEGEFTNRALVLNTVTGGAVSAQASATVRVSPDPTFDCTDVIGKVFDDRDRDGRQGPGELGLPDVRLFTLRGLAVRTDRHGRFHITCAIVPNERRGSNFVLKLDDRTLPSGYRTTTRQTRVARATRGKTLELDFGAAIQRVVGLDLSDAVFEPGRATLRTHWASRLPLLLDELEKEASILRLSYLADREDEALVRDRLDAVEDDVRARWRAREGGDLEIEREIFRRGDGREKRTARPRPTAAETTAIGRALPSVDAGPPPGLDALAPEGGQVAERHLPNDEPTTLWALDPEEATETTSDRLESRATVEEAFETIKLKDVVPPIRFESGRVDLPEAVVETIRDRLASMQHLQNVRLHLVGHADDQALSPALQARFGDNEGLSRERAGEMAEWLQRTLSLPPESVDFSWVGASEPIATNDTPEGRARNRRVEVEIWYDEPREVAATRDVVVREDVRRFKVCRTETVCKLRYREGHAQRARVRNLIPPLPDRDESARLPARFVEQVRETLGNLRDRRNVTVKILAHTDDRPLEGRAARIYGDAGAFSKARARRVALQLQEALSLPADAIESDGLGARQPVASNATPRGRALNRRIEVEFWYDDALLELPDEPQLCPNDEAGDTSITRVHDPSEGALPPLSIEDGRAILPDGFASRLERAFAEVADRRSPRVRFVGYTRNEGLTRRVADVYGDDIGLSASRARRAKEQLQALLALDDARVEHEGRGFVHADDVVNGGFLQGDDDYVQVQVVYDESAVDDAQDGIEALPLTRELVPRAPLSLNPMRITVDGVPIDDPERSSADIQRCTDVALDEAAIAFRFDDLGAERRLSLSSTPATSTGGPIRFRAYNNYPHFIERAEVRLFERGVSVRGEPIAILGIDDEGEAAWTPDPSLARSPRVALAAVLRVYDAAGRWDETAPQSLWLAPEGDGAGPLDPFEPEATEEEALRAGYGESDRVHRNIPLGSTSTIRISGDAIPEGHSVWLAGTELPVNDEGRFTGEVLLPAGLHTVEVAVLDEEGNGELFLRDLELERDDWFFVGLADLTLATDFGDGPANALGGNNGTDLDAWANGRLAFFTNGKWGEDWSLTASADTREGPVEDLFTNFLDKSPRSLFRRLDPDYHLPTFGDDSSIEELAPTLGKFYVKLEKGDDHLLWGNFVVRYDDNELALVERGLYGANLRAQSDELTSFGERRALLDVFASEPGTVPSREEFRGTGGSLYFLNRRDLLIGSERLRIEVRDKATGIVREVARLQPELDYDIDYLQGRVLLSEPLSAIADDRLLVRNDGLSGDEVWLVVQYEFTPGFDEVDVLNTGARAHYWFGDVAKLGFTFNRNEASSTDSSLYAADLTLRRSANSWLKLQASRSEGRLSTSLLSNDGGFDFEAAVDDALRRDHAYAYRADASLDFAEWIPALRGRLTAYGQRLDAGYSAPGLNTLTNTEQIGATLDVPVAEGVEVRAKADHTEQKDGLVQTAAELDVRVRVADDWQIEAGARHEDRRDEAAVIAATQEEGDRTDAVLQVGWDGDARVSAYAFGQATVRSTGNRDRNHRGGLGGEYRVSDRLSLEGEVSHGDLGPAARAGSEYQHDDRTQLYMNYALDSERGYDGLSARRGSLTTGARSRFGDSASVYAENQYQHASVVGLTRAVGVDYAPAERWTIGVSWEDGDTRDRRTSAETTRRAAGLRAGYGDDALQVSSGVEYVFLDTEQGDGSHAERATWLFRNNLTWQHDEDGRLLAKFNHAISDSSEGDFFDGGFTEAILGYAYRPVAHDRFFSLLKYTYFYNVPTTDQVGQNGTSAQFLQKSHIASLDLSYDLTDEWTLGARYAYRSSQVSLDREDPDFFDNDAHLAIVRVDWRFIDDWEALAEGRMLALPDLEERRAGALAAVYRYFGDHLKAGIGYNFTDFSEDLTDLSYDHHGLFFNIVGTF
ncbi:MAG: OmpA family protein [Myxococcota bacterium]